MSRAQRSRATTVPAQRRLGSGRGLRAAADRHHLQGQAGQGPGARRPQRLPLDARTHRRQGELRRGLALREQQRRHRRRCEDRRLTYDPAKTPGTGKGAAFCPGLWGGKDWPPEAYNPGTGMLYIPADNNMCGLLPGGENVKYKPRAGAACADRTGLDTEARQPGLHSSTLVSTANCGGATLSASERGTSASGNRWRRFMNKP